MENLNVWSFILSSLTPLLLGFFFYSKMLFGKTRITSTAMNDENPKKANLPLVIGLTIVMSFLLSFLMLRFCNDVGQEGQFDTFQHGAWHGAFLSVFVVIPVIVTNGLLEQKSWRNILLNGLYWSITIALMGGILDVMNHFPNR